MTDFRSEMNRAVEGFVAQITQLARRAALDTLESAFGTRTGRGREASAATVPLAGLAHAARPPGSRGTKRTAADLEALAAKFAAFVRSSPGLRIEQINKELGTTTRDLALPIRKLVADKVVATKGQKRSTTYHAGKKAT